MAALCAYEQEGYFSIIFEEAKWSLADYLRSDGTDFAPEELWNQVRGMADGLAHLHKGIGGNTIYHTDLKPANILIQNGIIKIADFGLLEYKTVPPPGDERSSGVDSGLAYRPYAAPPNTNGKFTRSMDVWSLGAIISEIATFDIQKKQGVYEYRGNRKDEAEVGTKSRFLSFHINGQIKKSVRHRHTILKDHINRSRSSEYRESVTPFQQNFFHNALFTLIERMLWFDDSCPTAGDVARDLKKFHSDAQEAVRTEASNAFTVHHDIWKETKEGALPNSPEKLERRLQVNTIRQHRCYALTLRPRCAYFSYNGSGQASERCGIHLHLVNNHQTIQIVRLQSSTYAYGGINSQSVSCETILTFFCPSPPFFYFIWQGDRNLLIRESPTPWPKYCGNLPSICLFTQSVKLDVGPSFRHQATRTFFLLV
jgi:serine/threonine protein kinase